MNKTIVEILQHHDIDGFEKVGGTDKNTIHNYVGSYERLLEPYRNKSVDVLEVGVQYGGSSLLWQDYMPNAKLAFVDIQDQMYQTIKDKLNFERCKYYIMDAYIDESVKKLTDDFSEGFDVMIEDGPHTLESQIIFIQKYLPILKKGGIMIIEDIQSLSYIEILKSITPKEFQDKIEVIDLVHTRGRYDDLMFVIRN